jgi:hypothetical protein
MISLATGAVSLPATSSARSAATTVGRALFDAAKVEGAAHAQRADDLDVGGRELAKMVGAEDVPPARGAAVGGRIAAEIAEIAGALQGEVTCRGGL